MLLKPSTHSYSQSGVDIAAGNAFVAGIASLAQSTHRAGNQSAIGGFGGVFDLAAAGLHDPLLVASCDGVGTKLMLAAALDRWEDIGVDLVAMCVNDLLAQGAEPLFFLDYIATSRLEPKPLTRLIDGIAQACREVGCSLLGGETAEMPGLYRDKEGDLAGFAVGVVERENLLPRGDIIPGDALVGVMSSGLHANGFSLLRRLIDTVQADLSAPFPNSGAKESLGDALMKPTRLYGPSLLPLLRSKDDVGVPIIKALAHITGGGIGDNLVRVLPPNTGGMVDLSAIPGQAVYDWLRNVGRLSVSDLLGVFNCGVGMIMVCSEADRDNLVVALGQQNEIAFDLGRVTATTDTKRVEFHNRLGFHGDSKDSCNAVT